MLLERLPGRALGKQLVCGGHLPVPFLRYALRCDWVPIAIDGLPSRDSSHTRKPPKNALALSPTRQPGGSSFSFLTFPPPKTTSSGWSAAVSRITTSFTVSRHFFLPRRNSPRMPT